MDFCWRSNFLHFYWLYPSTKRAIKTLSVSKIIYYSRAFTWYLQNPRGMCHVSRNVSQSLSTLRSKKSKRWTYLNKQPMWSSSGMSQDYKKVWHFYAEFFQIDWSRWGSVLNVPYKISWIRGSFPIPLLSLISSKPVLLKPRLLKIELESIVNKRLRFYRNLSVESSGDQLTGLN